MMVTEKSFDAGVVSLHYAEGPPAGTPLVLLHSVTSWWQDFLVIMPALAFRYHLYALDFRGHGRSGRVPGGYRYEDYAQDVILFVREQVREPAILLGHSLGGAVAVQVAAQAPELVRALVLEDPALFGQRGERVFARPGRKMLMACLDLVHTGYAMDAWVAALASLWPEGNAAELRAWAKSLSLVDPDVLALYIDGRASDNFYVDELLPQIACPVLLLRGEPELGGAITEEDARQAAALIKQCALVSVPGVGYLIHTPQPELFGRTVSDFLESL